MSSVTETVDLDFGIIINGDCYCSLVLRAARLSDIYAAAAAVEVPDGLQDMEPVRVAYQMEVDDAQVLAQIAQLGDLDPLPSIKELVATIDPDDMTLLRAGAARLKKKLRQSRPGFHPIVEPNTSSSEPASA